MDGWTSRQRILVLWITVVTTLSSGITEGSYLDRPRFHFSGQFQADPNTVNNEDNNFDPGNHNIKPHWNPDGTGDFRFYNTKVTSVTYLDGTHSQSDPIVGLPVLNTDAHTAGKIVDIDVDVQLRKSEIWGYHANLNWGKPGPQHNAFKGYITPSCLANDVWFRGICFQVEEIRSHLFSSVLKSVLTNVTWSEKLDSPLLRELKSTTKPEQLSVRIVVYFYVNSYNHSTTNFTFGTMQGTIGPAFSSEPTQFPEQRKLHYQQVKQPPPSFFRHLTQCQSYHGTDIKVWINDVPFGLTSNTVNGGTAANSSTLPTKLVADFGNAIAMDQHQMLLNLGTLVLGVYDREHLCVENLGYIDYQQDSWLEVTTGIQEFPNYPREWELPDFLTDIQLQLLQHNPVVVVHIPHHHHHHGEFSPDPDYQPEMKPITEDNQEFPTRFCWHHHSHSHHRPVHGIILLKEEPLYIRPLGNYIFRANPGEEHTLKLLVTKYGQPLNGAAVSLYPSHIKNFRKRDPPDGVTMPNNGAETDGDGISTLILKAHNVGQPRKSHNLDGQVYRYSYRVNLNTDTVNDVIEPDNDVIEPNKTSSTPPHEQELTPINDATIVVFSNVYYERPYTWVSDVQPIFQQFAQLYPIMKEVLDMSSYRDVKRYAIKLQHVLSLSIHNPSYMPVTRDLSKAKREMILEWLANGCRYDKDGEEPPVSLHKHHKCAQKAIWKELQLLDEEPPPPLPQSCTKGIKLHTFPLDAYSASVENYTFPRLMNIAKEVVDQNTTEYHHWDCMNVDWLEMSFMKRHHTIEQLHCLLQTAIRLEFSTIPPYLTALFSIIDGCNREAERLIRSVVMQEMLHMAQAANLLIATGGNPVINSRHFVPTYPGKLPGGVLPGLTVRIRRATRKHIHRNFMAIEYPSKTHVALPHPEVHSNTIGEFYTFIRKVMHELHREYKHAGKDLFCEDKCITNQVRWPTARRDAFGGKLYIVTDLDSADEAIQEIMEQGEGVGPFNPGDGGRELAHYYKFEEIVCGHKLVKTEHDRYDFVGEKIELDESGVYPMRNNPSIRHLQPDTNAYHISKVFGEIYRQLLNRIHLTFNGDPNGFNDSVSIMWSLKMYAKKLMKIPVDGCPSEDGCPRVGPSWELDIE